VSAAALAAAALVLAGGGAASPSLAGHHPAVTVRFAVSPSRSQVRAGLAPSVRYLRVQDAGTAPVTLSATVKAGRQLADGSSVFRPPGPDSGASWVTVSPSHFTLQPGQILRVRLVVAVPRQHDTGQRYLGIAFADAPHRAAGHAVARVQASIVSELIIGVPGPVRRAVSYSLSAPRWSWGGAVPLRLSIANRGNVLSLANHLRAVAPGGTVAFPGTLTLGGSVRVVAASDGSLPGFCFPCHVRGPGGSTAAVWRVSPLPLAGGLALLLAAGLGLWARRASRGRGQRAAARAPGRRRRPGRVASMVRSAP
jgi:hypothetical protein